MKSTSGLAPFVCVVDFDHARGPEVEAWVGIPDVDDLLSENDWSLLPFMALSDGSHASQEEFSYFTLPFSHSSRTDLPISTSLFGIACTRQLDARNLLVKPESVTRSTVQKAVVVISDSPQFFSLIKEKLSIVTRAWFNQYDFSNIDILVQFQLSLADKFVELDPRENKHFGLSFRELLYRFKHQALTLFKACLLQKKIIFYGARCEELCLTQFALISLIPGLLQNLNDCAEPEFDSYDHMVKPSSSLQSSDRSSLLAYMGLPLQLFGKGCFFGPYIPLQQLDLLAHHGTQSYIVGSTNSLLLQLKDQYSEVFVNMDDYSIHVTPQLRSALVLTVADRRWIDGLTQSVVDTWDKENPTRPTTMKYFSGEDFLRVQFEDYLLCLTASAKYHVYLESQSSPKKYIPEIGEKDPFLDFGIDWTAEWSKSANYAIFSRITDADIYNVTHPLHPCAGNLTFSDLQRRMNHQLTEMHWDEKLQQGQDAVKSHLASGKEKISAALSRIWSETEDRQKLDDGSPSATAVGNQPAADDTASKATAATTEAVSVESAVNKTLAPAGINTPDCTDNQTPAKTAGTYISSWGAWAAEKRTGWSWSKSATPSRTQSPHPKAEEPVASKARDSQISAPIDPPIQSGLASWTQTGGKNVLDEDEDEDESILYETIPGDVDDSDVQIDRPGTAVGYDSTPHLSQPVTVEGLKD